MLSDPMDITEFLKKINRKQNNLMKKLIKLDPKLMAKH